MSVQAGILVGMFDPVESPSSTSSSPPPSTVHAVESYSIRVASRLTGIPADTLRMWERRYGFPRPERRATGVRSYGRDDIERLLLVARALRLGFRPGEVVGKSKGDLEPLLASAGAQRASLPRSASVMACVEAVERFDPTALSAELRRALAGMGQKPFLLEVAHPLVARVRELWIEGQMAVRHERLVASALSAQIQQLLATYEGGSRAPSFLLTTLPGEPVDIDHELSALFIAASGGLPRLFGDLPPDQIIEAASALRSDAVCVSIAEGSNQGAAASQLRWLAEALPSPKELWITGPSSDRIDVRGARVKTIVAWPSFEQHIERLRSAAASPPAVHVDADPDAF